MRLSSAAGTDVQSSPFFKCSCLLCSGVLGHRIGMVYFDDDAVVVIVIVHAPFLHRSLSLNKPFPVTKENGFDPQTVITIPSRSAKRDDACSARHKIHRKTAWEPGSMQSQKELARRREEGPTTMTLCRLWVE
ncbi:hypothetical protein CSAL01_13020 [Colletotrichum salicis]|uniref:Uncharacterized protein n=1 Tax=Colletotrichum salicis TaxID=1209931 RepID=A0A135UKM0_9PEZI|nr:hypothetical protein CSAL01_13020 [Colletotrichum salicis]